MARIESWVQIVERERKARGLSQDDLAYEARQHGAPKGLSSAWFSKVKQGQRPATLDFLRGIAGALGFPPERFVEYRLAVARRDLDEKEVGLERALQALAVYEAAGPKPAEGGGADQARADRATQAAKDARAETRKSRGRSAGKQASKAKKRRAG